MKDSSKGVSMFNQDSFHNVLNITIKCFANSQKNICCDIFTAPIFAIKAAETSLIFCSSPFYIALNKRFPKSIIRKFVF